MQNTESEDGKNQKMKKKILSKSSLKGKDIKQNNEKNDNKDATQNIQGQIVNQFKDTSEFLKDVEMCKSSEFIMTEYPTSFCKTFDDDKKQRNKTKTISYLTLGFYLLQIISFIEILSIIGSIVVFNNNSTLLQKYFLLVIILFSRVWKMIYFLRKKMFQGFILCILLLDHIAILRKAKKMKENRLDIEIIDKQERMESKVKSEEIEKRKNEYIQKLHQDYDKKAILKCQGKIKSISTFLTKEIKQENQKRTTASSQILESFKTHIVQEQDILKLEKQQQIKQILTSQEEEKDNQQKIDLLFQQKIPTNIESNTQDIFIISQFKKNSSVEIGQILDSQVSQSLTQDQLLLSKQMKPKTKQMMTQTIEIDNVIIDCQKLQAKSNTLTEGCFKNMDNEVENTKEIQSFIKMNEQQQKNNRNLNFQTIITKLNHSIRNQGNQQVEVKKSKFNLFQIVQENIKNKVDSRFKGTKTIISFSEFNKIFQNKLKSSIFTKYQENSLNEDSEKYFFERKWISINIRIIDGLTLSGPTLILIAYWQSINCDGINQLSKNIVNLSFWSCSICLALSICLLSSVQYIPLRNTAHAFKKQIQGMIKEYLGLLACVVNSALSIAVGLQSNILISLIEILLFGSILYQIWIILSDLQKNLIEEVKKKFYFLRILGIAVSPLIFYLLLICSFQINFSSEFLEATLPQLLEEIPKLSLFEINRFSHKFKMIINILNKILLFYPINSALLLIFDLLHSKVYMNFSLDSYINTQRLLAWILWLICVLRCINKQFLYQNFIRKIGDKALEHENMLLKQLENEYFIKYQLLKEKEKLQNEAHEKIKMSIREIGEFNQIINEKEDQQNKLSSFLNKFGGESGNVMEKKMNNLQNAILSKIQFKLKISKLEYEKKKNEKYIIDQKESLTILQHEVENLAIKLQQLGIDTKLTQQTQK